MDILLLNQDPTISKLVKVAANKYEFIEAKELNPNRHYKIIILNDDLNIDTKELKDKCTRLILLSATNDFKPSTWIYHIKKPFIVGDLTRLIDQCITQNELRPIKLQDGTESLGDEEEECTIKLADDFTTSHNENILYLKKELATINTLKPEKKDDISKIDEKELKSILDDTHPPKKPKKDEKNISINIKLSQDLKDALIKGTSININIDLN